ncbi:hypothetical protein [Serratia nevei]|uniref:hypothetical protein n=1 Tax=Serratia nevei TaxID=2703794 RepID=UPI00249AB9DB|nr:hypothetical protein [Serratia nevei]MDI3151387.1 hypothetical protein [Serratia nevei]
MDANVNSRKNTSSPSPIENIVSYIKENFKVKDEDTYGENNSVGLIAFLHEELTYIVDVYPKKPQHLRAYILFDEPSDVRIINKVNALSRFSKGTNITQSSGERLCIEIEQMMYGIQTKASAEHYILFVIEYLKKYLHALSEEESLSEQEGA